MSRFQATLSYVTPNVMSGTCGGLPQQAAHLPFDSQQYDVGGLLEVVRKPDDADGDKVNRHDVVQDARHQQDEYSGDQSDQLIRRTNASEHKRSAMTCPRLKA
jgi:hypothetical protein